MGEQRNGWKMFRSFGNINKWREQIIYSKFEFLHVLWKKREREREIKTRPLKHIKVQLETKRLTWKNREGTFFDLDTPWRSIDSNLTNCTLSLAICCLINSIWENRRRRVGLPMLFTSGSLLDTISEEECSGETK